MQRTAQAYARLLRGRDASAWPAGLRDGIVVTFAADDIAGAPRGAGSGGPFVQRLAQPTAAV